jgi:hypothetical protein
MKALTVLFLLLLAASLSVVAQVNPAGDPVALPFGCENLQIRVVYGLSDQDIPIDPPLDLVNNPPLVMCYQWHESDTSWVSGPNGGGHERFTVYEDHIEYYASFYGPNEPVVVVILEPVTPE